MTATIPFLTEIDTRAEVKGSRDPLGLVAIWAHFGRRVVGNLSTVSTNLRDYTVRVFGQWIVERIAEVRPDSQLLPAFLRFEQLCGYARYCHDADASFRGVERVRSNLADSRRVTLSAAADHQLLGNQRTYGVWGMYSVPSASSGLLEQDHSLASPGRALVEKTCLPFLISQRIDPDKDLVRWLAEPKVALDLDGRHRPLVAAMGKLLGPALRSLERPIYESHLLCGGPQDATQGRQELLARQLAKVADGPEQGLTPSLFRAIAKEASKLGSPQLASDLEAIRICEGVLAPAARIFGWLARCSNQPRDWLVKQMHQGLGARVPVEVEAFRGLCSQIQAGATTSADAWIRVAEGLSAGDYGTVLDQLLSLNAQVMRERAGSPWLEFRDGKLAVRFRDDTSELPEAAELPRLWRHSYFVDSLQAMVAQVWGRE